MKKLSIGRRIVNGVMRLFGYAPNPNGFLAKDYVVPGVLAVISPTFEMLMVDWKRIPADSAKTLVGYIYGLSKGIAIYAELRDPEISFFAAWQTMLKIFPGREDLIKILHACQWDDPEVKVGVDLGIDDAALFLSGSHPVSRLSKILIERHEEYVLNDDIVRRFYDMEGKK
ncbi:hypothetical protein PO002_20520 [Cupriavidus necator]|uniref:hypothetical protein n=1 Tax=Cupriavidus necator TaxID=106590 RepID=UPI0039C1D527